MHALRRNVSLVRGAGANVVAVPSAEGSILVDGGSAEHADAVLDTVRTSSDTRRIAALFNTNWRPEHTGLNEAAGSAGARIIAHENTKLWLGNDFTVRWEQRRHTPRPPHALPTETFYTTGRLDLDDETIDYGHVPQAHTDGDIYVFFRRANVLAVSDLLAAEGYPVVDYATGGWIGGMLRATEALLALTDDETLIVPAVGAPQRRAALEAQLELCTTIRAAVGQAYAKAQSLAEFIAADPAAQYRAARGNPELFLELAYKGAWGHVRELGIGVV